MSHLQEFGNVRHILITGPPGSGKTTIVIKICELLANLKIPMTGFYTKELRSGSSRIGFDIYTLDNKIGPLARINNGENSRGPKVGKYVVDVPSFESIALPALTVLEKKSVMIIDEIGKMELFSKEFENKVKELFNNEKLVVIATIPNKGPPIPLINRLKTLPSSSLIEVNMNNRDNLPAKIASNITKTYNII